MNRSEVADVLDRAADALMIYGRGTGSLETDDGRLCALGAIGRQSNVSTSTRHGSATPAALGCYSTEAAVAFGRYLLDTGRAALKPTLAENPANAVWLFNDTTDDDGEVIDQLRRCAKELREVGE